jgi:shikimate dehydrogenase
MRKFGLIGYPLGHSFSKKYFNDKFNNEQITDCSYQNYPLTDISEFKILLTREPELFGLNVTIPYKSVIIRYLNTVDTESHEIGAVNVIKIKRSDSKIWLDGYNSDVTGIRDSILPYIKDNIKNSLVLGTGGSSRAVCYVLRRLGLKVTLVSRNKKAGILSYSGINSSILENTDIIVNTTPLGMYPDIESKPDLDYNLLNEKHILFDLVYNPELTIFLKMGMERGCTIIGGLKMLHSQAEKAWEIWNDDKL